MKNCVKTTKKNSKRLVPLFLRSAFYLFPFSFVENDYELLEISRSSMNILLDTLLLTCMVFYFS